MRYRTLPLAKLSRPRQSRVLPRPRLFALLDEARDARALWIAGPAGMGKTTLVSSYLERDRREGIWYQLDRGDSDPATFFFFLAEAARGTRKRGTNLPLLKPEYQGDIEAFSRRFFRRLYGVAPPNWALVLDNHQEVTSISGFHRLVKVAIDEAPEGVTIFVIGRTDPPPELARTLAGGTLHAIAAGALAFDLEETRALVKLRASPIDADTLRAVSGGWAAGMMLLLVSRSGHVDRLADDLDTSDAIFNYFAEEVLSGSDENLQRFLMLTAFFPRLTAGTAAALTGDAAAGKVLDDLYRRHFFVDRRSEPDPVYQYHDLFRSFLHRRARERYPAHEVLRIQRDAARLLQVNGHADEALPLFLAAGDAEAAAALILDCARPLLAQGRRQTLVSWLDALPPAQIEASCELQHLRGLSLLATDQRGARDWFERAFRGSIERRDAAGQLLAAIGVIDSYVLENADLLSPARWVSAIEHLVPDWAPLLEPRDQLHVYASLLAALTHCQPAHPLLPVCRDRACALLERDLEANSRVAAASAVLSYSSQSGDFTVVRGIARVISPLLRGSEVTPLSEATFRARLATSLMGTMEDEEAQRLVGEVRSIATAHGLVSLEALSYAYDTYLALYRADYDAARHKLAQWGSLARRGPQDLTYWHFCHAALAHGLGDLAEALRHAHALADAAGRGGARLLMVFAEAILPVLLAETGDHEAARARLTRLKDRHYGTPFKRLDALIDGAEAYVELLQSGLMNAVPALQRFFSGSRTNGVPSTWRIMRRLEGRLFEAALRAGIEVPYVQTMIRRRAAVPESPDVPNWPWPLQIFALGRLRVLSEGVQVGTGHKTQRRPLELLATLVAAGGSQVPAREVMDMLWPDAAGDAAQSSFEITLHRLRKLVGRASAIRLTDGKLALDPDCCWVDAWAFDRLATVVLDNATRSERGFERTALAAFDLYAGHFLAAEPEEHWILKPRGRLRARFVRVAVALGRSWEAGDQWDRAARLYERALDVDALAEPVYQGLIRCQRHLGRSAEAIQTYQRCRRLLETGLGVQPSATTEALYRELRAD